MFATSYASLPTSSRARDEHSAVRHTLNDGLSVGFKIGALCNHQHTNHKVNIKAPKPKVNLRVRVERTGTQE